MLFNKAWCGFACPLGTLQDWITKLRSKLGTRYSTYSEGAFKGLKKIKYILLVLLILLPIGMSNAIPDIVRLHGTFQRLSVIYALAELFCHYLTLTSRSLRWISVQRQSSLSQRSGWLLQGYFCRGICEKTLFLPVLPYERFALYLFKDGDSQAC